MCARYFNGIQWSESLGCALEISNFFFMPSYVLISSHLISSHLISYLNIQRLTHTILDLQATMASLPGLRSIPFANRVLFGRLGSFQRGFRPDRPITSGSFSKSNDILFNATTSMKNDKERKGGATARSGNLQPPKNVTFAKRNPKFGNSASGQHFTKKRASVKWTSGTERARNAANHVLQQVLKLNDRGIVKVVNQESNTLEEKAFVNWAAGIDLDQMGFILVNIEQRSSGSIPLIKVVDSKTALKKYSDELAERKKEELIKMGFSSKRLGKKNDKDTNTDNLKQIKISWQISDSDLNKQKANEITSQLKKGHKVYLYLNGKEELSKVNWSDDIPTHQEDEKKSKGSAISPKEYRRRETVLESLHEIVSELAIQPVLEGSIDSRLIMKLNPKPASNKNDKAALREERKQLKQAKLESKLLRKKNKEFASSQL
ncbi:LAFA_0G05402g1_1 [Lachancea sp. 'fantastica']|nr:LAFA_0G05402g1_1 [Lachancea sp. 'fantastica']